jgi:hypothetical protein
LSALEQSQPSVPHSRQNEWRAVLEPLLKPACVRSWKAFVSGTLCVGIEAQGGELVVIPAVNCGARDGFDQDEANKKLIAMRVSAEAIGAVLRSAIASPR